MSGKPAPTFARYVESVDDFFLWDDIVLGTCAWIAHSTVLLFILFFTNSAL